MRSNSNKFKVNIWLQNIHLNQNLVAEVCSSIFLNLGVNPGPQLGNFSVNSVHTVLPMSTSLSTSVHGQINEVVLGFQFQNMGFASPKKMLKTSPSLNLPAAFFLITFLHQSVIIAFLWLWLWHCICDNYNNYNHHHHHIQINFAELSPCWIVDKDPTAAHPTPQLTTPTRSCCFVSPFFTVNGPPLSPWYLFLYHATQK